MALQALGALLIVLRGSVPDWMSIVLANLLVVTGALAGLLGLERFVGRRGPQMQNYLLLAAFAAVHSYFTFVRPDLGARNLNLSILLLVLCAQCVWLLRYRTPLSLRRAAFGAGVVFGGYCLVSLARVVVVAVGSFSAGDFFESGGFDKLVLLAYQALLILLAFSFLLMVTSRLRTEVRTQEESHRGFVDNMAEGYAYCRLISADGVPQDWVFLAVNNAFETLTGLKEAAGRPASEVIPGIMEADPDLLATFARVAQSGTPERFETYVNALDIWFSISVFSPEREFFVAVFHVITERIRTTEALQSNMERLGLALEAAKAGTWEWDLATNANVWSEELWRLYGLEPHSCEPSHEAWLQTVHSDDRAAVERAVREAERTGAEQTIEWRTGGGDGTERRLMSRGRPALNAEGTVAGYHGIVLDISELKRVEAALRESEHKFRETILYLDEGYYSVTLEGKLRDHNRAFARIIGFPQDEDLRGADVPDFWSDPAKRREYVAALTAGAAISSHQVEAKKRSGEKIAVLLSAHVVTDGSGPQHHIEGVVLDITARIRAEEELRQLNQDLERRVAERALELSDLYNNAPCGYHSLDEDSVIVRINDTELDWLGYTREEVLGKLRLSDIITPASLETFGRNFPVFKKQGRIRDLEFDLLRKDGTIMPVLLSATAVVDQEGRFLMSRSTMIDYADRKEAEAALRRSQTRFEAVNKELEAFAYSVSHDLRAPLRAIDGFSQMILEDYGDTFDAEGRRLFDAVRANAQRMDQLITDLLALSKVARAETVASRLDMGALVREVYGEIAPTEVEPAVSLSVSSLPEVYGDETLIRQVWSNLLSNALKYTSTKPDRHIEVGGYVDGPLTVYYVKDNGVGFDPRYAHKLFGLFQRLHKASDFEDTGVGLAIVQRIIHLHDGKVWGEGIPDQGATFYFVLPTDPVSRQIEG